MVVAVKVQYIPAYYEIPSSWRWLLAIEIVPVIALFNLFNWYELTGNELVISSMRVRTVIELNRIKSIKVLPTPFYRRFFLCMPSKMTRIEYDRYQEEDLWGDFSDVISECK
jgi:hypothetical protein